MEVNTYKNIVSVEVYGKPRFFKFGMGAFAHAMKLENCTLKDLIDRIVNSDLNTILSIIYAASVQYAQLEKQAEPTQAEVNDWVDNTGMGVFNEAITAAFKIYPNEEAPKPETEKGQ